MHHRYRHVPLRAPERRQFNPWQSFTSAVGSVFDPQDDGSSQADDGSGAGPGVAVSTIFRTSVMTVGPGGVTGPLTKGEPDPSVVPHHTDPGPTTVQFFSAPDETGLPSSISSTPTHKVPTTLAVATDPPKVTHAAVQPTPSTTSVTSSDNGSTSTGAKAGIAIGVLAGVFLLVGLVFFFFKKRRQQSERQQLDDDEKINGPAFISAAAVPHSPVVKSLPNAPRLSLRPESEFLPSLAPSPQQLRQQQQVHPDRRTSRGAAIGEMMNQSPALGRPVGGSPWERPMTSASAHSTNPFGDSAERLNSPVTHENTPVSPVSAASDVGSMVSLNSPPHESPVGAAAAGAAIGAVAGAAAVGLTRKASTRKDAPKALDLTLPPALGTVPPSPAGTEFSMHSIGPGQSPGPSASAAAIAAAGGPPTSAVHRVQLDFIATLEDEMDLKAGQLVRLLHEYDDGWALCIRLDRSRQGVVPRTCLSTRPVKPRPAQGGPRVGPPVNPSGPGARGPNSPPGARGPNSPPGGRGPNSPPGGRGPNSPPGGRGPNSPPGQRALSPQNGRYSPPGQRPMAPQGNPGHPRPQSPAGRPMGPPPNAGRPASPAGGRSMSPGPRPQSPGPNPPQGRPQSPNGANRRMSPPGPSAMNQEHRPGPPPSGPIGRKPVPGQAY